MQLTKELIGFLLYRYQNIGLQVDKDNIVVRKGVDWLKYVESYEDKVRVAVLYEQIANHILNMVEISYDYNFENIVFPLAQNFAVKHKAYYNAKSFVNVLYSEYLKMKENIMSDENIRLATVGGLMDVGGLLLVETAQKLDKIPEDLMEKSAELNVIIGEDLDIKNQLEQILQ